MTRLCHQFFQTVHWCDCHTRKVSTSCMQCECMWPCGFGPYRQCSVINRACAFFPVINFCQVKGNNMYRFIISSILCYLFCQCFPVNYYLYNLYLFISNISIRGCVILITTRMINKKFVEIPDPCLYYSLFGKCNFGARCRHQHIVSLSR